MLQVMIRWQYGLAEYDGATIAAHPEYMSDITDTSGNFMPFLVEAGERGWELCGTVPVPSTTANLASPERVGLIFKRPTRA